METLTATMTQKNFGSVMRKIDRAPVCVSQHGEARAVILGVDDFRILMDRSVEFGTAYYDRFEEQTYRGIPLHLVPREE